MTLILKLEEMGTRIHDLEKNVTELMTQAGMDECQTGEQMAPKVKLTVTSSV